MEDIYSITTSSESTMETLIQDDIESSGKKQETIYTKELHKIDIDKLKHILDKYNIN